MQVIKQHPPSRLPFVTLVKPKQHLPQIGRGISACNNAKRWLACVIAAAPVFIGSTVAAMTQTLMAARWEDAALSTRLNQSGMKQRRHRHLICTCAAHPSARVIGWMRSSLPPLQTFRTREKESPAFCRPLPISFTGACER